MNKSDTSTMVSKSYVVSKFAKSLVKKTSKSENDDEEKCDMHVDQVMKEEKKNKNSFFFIHLNEMVSHNTLFFLLLLCVCGNYK